MLSPRSIAVIGASNEMEYGGRVMYNLRRAGYSGAIYPVNPRQTVIQGIPAYADVRDIPGPVDLAVLVVSARIINEVIAACGEKGIPAGVVITAGYAEQGAEGVARQEELVRAAHHAGMRISGPNSLGVANLSERMFAAGSNCEWDVMPILPGAISVVSQSGALAFTSLLARAHERGVGLRHLISVGNQADLTVVDFLDYLVEADEGTRVIAVFLEGLPANQGRRLIDVARRAALRGKAILVLKVARSPQGQEAARSHTAALIGRDAVYDGVFQQFGVVRVADLDDLWEVGQLFAAYPDWRPSGGLGFLSNSGGMNSVFVDACGAEDMAFPQLAPRTLEDISTILAGRGSAGNPVDASGQINRPSLQDILSSMENDPAIDIIAIGSTTPGSGQRSLEIAAQVCAAHAKSDFPHVMLWASATTLHGRPTAEQAGITQVQAAGVPVFLEATKCARALRAFREHHLRRREIREGATRPAGPVSVDVQMPQRVAATGDLLSDLHWLESAGIAIAPTEAAADVQQALAAAHRLGYPVVLKIDAPGLMHKTEVGGVIAGITDDAALRQAYAALWERTDALGAARQVLVQAQVQGGVEFILGGLIDPVFGPVVMAGSGGIWVELAEDAVFRAAPLDSATARHMLAGLRASRQLSGLRGAPRGDEAALVQALVAFSHLVAALDGRIQEIEINPLMVLPAGQGVRAVDVLLVPADVAA